MKRLLSIILLALIVSSCNSRVDLGYTPQASDDEIIQVSFNGLLAGFSQGGLKSYPTGTAEKLKHRIHFSGIRIVLYSVDKDDPSQPDKVAYVFDKDVKAVAGVFSGADYLPSPASSNEGIAFQIKGSEKIKADNYLVYYFTSCNDQLKSATTVGNPFSEITGTLNYDRQKDFDHNRLINNIYHSPEPIKISKSLFDDNAINKTYQLPAPKLTAINALLSVKWKNAVKDDKYEILGDYILVSPDVQNLKYILFPEVDEHLKSKFQVYYPIDPNYGGFSTKSIEELTNEFLYLGTYTRWVRSSHDTNFTSSYRPIPENTVASSETSAKVITRVLLSVRMLPKSLKSQLSSTQLESPDLGWVNYKGKPYLDTDFLQLYQSLIKKSNPSNEEKDFLEIGSRIMNSSNNGLAKKGYQDDDIQYFYHSLNYFSFPITHTNLDTVGGSIDNGGYFGVVRNHHYEYIINSFSTIGNASPYNLSYDLDYLTDRFISSSCEIGDMKEIVNEIDVL